MPGSELIIKWVNKSLLVFCLEFFLVCDRRALRIILWLASSASSDKEPAMKLKYQYSQINSFSMQVLTYRQIEKINNRTTMN